MNAVSEKLLRAVLDVLKDASPRPLRPGSVAAYATGYGATPVTEADAKAALAALEEKGFAQRHASPLDPEALSWTCTDAGTRA